MRIASGGISLETNTFASQPTTLEDFIRDSGGGPSVPIVATLDLHANITALMAEQADVLIGYDTYPHVDMGDRGVEALNLIADIAAGKVRPTMAY